MKQKFYAFVVNKKSGVVDTWDECKQIVHGNNGAKYKSFGTRTEAELWIKTGGDYSVKYLALEQGIYFDAGTGSGNGVEVSVVNEKGENLLDLILDKKEINLRGKQLLLGKTNNFGELLACKYALQIALKNNILKVFGDSKLVIDYWSKGYIKKEMSKETIDLAHEVKFLRNKFEAQGGSLEHISGGQNPADLGFHKN